MSGQRPCSVIAFISVLPRKANGLRGGHMFLSSIYSVRGSFSALAVAGSSSPRWASQQPAQQFQKGFVLQAGADLPTNLQRWNGRGESKARSQWAPVCSPLRTGAPNNRPWPPPNPYFSIPFGEDWDKSEWKWGTTKRGQSSVHS